MMAENHAARTLSSRQEANDKIREAAPSVSFAITACFIMLLSVPPASATAYAITPSLIASIRSAAAKKLKVLYSAHFDSMVRTIRANADGEPTDVVCGYIRSKRRSGTFSGRRPFIYFVKLDNFMTQRLGDATDAARFPAMLKTFCDGLI